MVNYKIILLVFLSHMMMNSVRGDVCINVDVNNRCSVYNVDKDCYELGSVNIITLKSHEVTHMEFGFM